MKGVPLSPELRQRIIKVIKEGGVSTMALRERFHIGTMTIARLRKEAKEEKNGSGKN